MQTTMTMRRPLRRLCATFLALAFASLGLAQTSTTGSIEGRVQNVTKGDYLGNARVTVENTNLSALTDQYGQYAIANVPAGTVKVTAFYSGLAPVTQEVTVTAGSRAMRDFDLEAGVPANGIVKLEAYTVTSTHEMSPAALATNEQRFAPNMKTVLSAEEFGEQSENNVAEFLKLMPAVQISYVDQDARNASLRGLPSYATIVTANGNQVASAASSTGSRVFEFEQISMNEIARVEVNKTLVPDMPAEGIGGTINLITKSAFERSRPSFSFHTYLNFNTTALTLDKTPGPFRDKTYKIRPGFDFSYINPLSKNFGITVSGSHSDKYNPQWYADPAWNLNLNKTTGVESPYVSSFQDNDGPKSTERDSARVGFDWRFAPQDVLSVGFSEQYYRALIGLRRMNLSIGSSPSVITPDYVQGRAGAGSEYFGSSMNDKSGTTWTPEFKYTHNGPIWQVEAGGSYSHAGNDYYAADKGFFSGVSMSLHTIDPVTKKYVGPTFRFDYTGNFLPDVTTTMADGTTRNPWDAAQLTLDSANALRRKSTDLKKTLRVNAQRTFDLRFPLRVKFGGDTRESLRDIREITPNWTFLGPDGIAQSADNFASNYDIFDESISSVAPHYGQRSFHWFDPYKIYQLLVQHPTWWYNDPVAVHDNLVNRSRFITEKINSAFIRLDAQFFHNRLLVTGGWRYQQYKAHTEAGEVNNLGKYLTDNDGNIIIDPTTNKPVLIPGNPDLATNVERGVKGNLTKGGWYPSVNATYRIMDNLQFRASFAKSINYPELSDLLGGIYVADWTESPRRVYLDHPLRPWSANNYDLELEYFTKQGGHVSVSWWRKEIHDFVTDSVFTGADAQPVLDRNGYGALYGLGYDVDEVYNGGFTVMEGWEADMRQTLDPWAPDWGKGLTVFFNTSYKGAPRVQGPSSIDVWSTRSINWGADYQRGRVGFNLKFNFVQEPKRLYYSASATHQMSRTYTDADVTFRLTKHFSLFASGTNIFGVPVETFVYDPATPVYAIRRSHHFYGVQCVAGVKGQF